MRLSHGRGSRARAQVPPSGCGLLSEAWPALHQPPNLGEQREEPHRPRTRAAGLCVPDSTTFPRRKCFESLSLKVSLLQD